MVTIRLRILCIQLLSEDKVSRNQDSLDKTSEYKRLIIRELAV